MGGTKMLMQKVFRSILLFLILILAACSNENQSPTAPSLSNSNDELIGIWELISIEYYSGTNLITESPKKAGISVTFKFNADKSGQILNFQNGNSQISNFSWSIRGATLTLIYEDGTSESLTCNLNDSLLKISYAYKTSSGENVLATFVFENES
jgi:hypothetical protein